MANLASVAFSADLPCLCVRAGMPSPGTPGLGCPKAAVLSHGHRVEGLAALSAREVRRSREGRHSAVTPGLNGALALSVVLAWCTRSEPTFDRGCALLSVTRVNGTRS